MKIFKDVNSELKSNRALEGRGDEKKATRRKKANHKPVRSIEDNPEIVKLEKPKKDLSDREIRNKLDSHLNKSNSATTMNKLKKEEMLGAGFLNEEVVTKQKELQRSKEEAMLVKAESLSGVKGDNAKPEIQKTTISVEKIERPSDVGVNNPSDPVTANKLKSVLDMGAFNFNPKEREVLSRILEEKA